MMRLTRPSPSFVVLLAPCCWTVALPFLLIVSALSLLSLLVDPTAPFLLRSYCRSREIRISAHPGASLRRGVNTFRLPVGISWANRKRHLLRPRASYVLLAEGRQGLCEFLGQGQDTAKLRTRISPHSSPPTSVYMPRENGWRIASSWNGWVPSVHEPEKCTRFSVCSLKLVFGPW